MVVITLFAHKNQVVIWPIQPAIDHILINLSAIALWLRISAIGLHGILRYYFLFCPTQHILQRGIEIATARRASPLNYPDFNAQQCQRNGRLVLRILTVNRTYKCPYPRSRSSVSKYAIVARSPSSNLIEGCQPNCSFASVISGLRCIGSSLGSGS